MEIVGKVKTDECKRNLACGANACGWGGGSGGSDRGAARLKRRGNWNWSRRQLDSPGIQDCENCWVQNATCETVMDGGGGCRVSGFMSF